jgi:hypothetical protein
MSLSTNALRAVAPDPDPGAGTEVHGVQNPAAESVEGNIETAIGVIQGFPRRLNMSKRAPDGSVAKAKSHRCGDRF